MKDIPSAHHFVTRRTIIKGLSSAAGIYVGLPCSHAKSVAPERLDAKDPAALKLSYVSDAAQVDTKKHPEYVSGSTCDNCLQLQGSAGDSYRPCKLFPGKLVSVGGWCQSWTPEM